MNAAIILPSLNPDEKMIGTIDGLLEYGFKNIIVVNDGSAEEYTGPFEEARKHPEVTVLKHEVNKGKGRAMKTAFEYVISERKDIDCVITVDGDGQHTPKDIKRCLDALQDNPDDVVLGVRDFSQPNVPLRSRFGNNITRLVFRLACGVKVSDTQTGLRAIPSKYLPLMVTIDGERYEYETNQLLMLKQEKIGITEVTIETVYIDDNASSHFNTVKDSIRIYAVILKFIGSSCISFLIDILMFTLINMVLSRTDIGRGLGSPQILFISTVLARVVSSLINYTLNRKVVFRSRSGVGSSMARYYILAVCQMLVSYGLLTLFAHRLLGIRDGSILNTLVKLVVDCVLFLISFQIQQRWVFASR